MEVVKGINITNEDNMELMARYPDNHFDLAVVDPPYGIERFKRAGRMFKTEKDKNGLKWDTKPTKEYFKQLLFMYGTIPSP